MQQQEMRVNLDQFIRKPPTPHAEAVAARAAIERANRATRDRNRKAVTFSAFD